MKPARGFTLVEILIALAIFAIVSILAYRATSAMTDSEARLTEEAAHWRTFEQVFTRIENDVQQALPRPMLEGNVVQPAWYGAVSDANAGMMQFARAPSRLPSVISANNPASFGQRIAYQWQDGKLEMLYWPQFDNPGKTEPQRYLLLDGLTSFAIEYLGDDMQWRNNWLPTDHPDATQLPRALRIRLAGRDGQIVERIFVIL